MNDITPVELDWKDKDGIAATRQLIVSVFADSVRYPARRIAAEIRPLPLPQYRRFVLVWHDGRLAGAGGIKSADWSSDTHILYLSAVDAEARGRGIGRALVGARLDWIRERHAQGRVLVSTAKPKRYRDFGFRELGGRSKAPTSLMLLEF